MDNRNLTMSPVTVHQLLAHAEPSEDGYFYLDDVRLHNVRVYDDDANATFKYVFRFYVQQRSTENTATAQDQNMEGSAETQGDPLHLRVLAFLERPINLQAVQVLRAQVTTAAMVGHVLVAWRRRAAANLNAATAAAVVLVFVVWRRRPASNLSP
ncbi:hypothetical protein R1sor_007394 [Riccia sorocarpa]|uniref:Uncharacterized protein n=1 Tax=Riccia sorocarpa TaxID=122646 RepID=A0ABD3HQM9_9MARC